MTNITKGTETTTPVIFIVQFDKIYLDGTLAGLDMPGQTITCPDRSSAERALALYAAVAKSGDFMRDHKGDRFTVSHVELHHA
ncbi:MAG: hypothetical protein A3E78_12220 [Alphaproteobacteria bacterium RIFCSPHIGHO2_12_FULL_63_12]|nr:MAG: hypothetical protein A3E78_12220 [Alphaproteobacteria bacterium RIFCSPHIGHO2_12_FULL_63_12]